MFEAISLVMMILFVNLVGIVFEISEIYTMSVSFVITVWMGWILRKLKAPFLPSSQKKITTMIHLADITTGDVVYELGSGDGRILRASLIHHPKKVVGYELSPWLVWYSRLCSLHNKDNIIYHRADIFQQDFSDADVLFCFLLPQGMKKIMTDIRPTLKPGTKLISNLFTLGDLTPDAHQEGVYCYKKK